MRRQGPEDLDFFLVPKLLDVLDFVDARISTLYTWDNCKIKSVLTSVQDRRGWDSSAPFHATPGGEPKSLKIAWIVVTVSSFRHSPVLALRRPLKNEWFTMNKSDCVDSHS